MPAGATFAPDELGPDAVTPMVATHGRRLLLVTYQHPPMPFLGGDPWGGLATQLRRQGHELTVITTGTHGALPSDAAAGVVRTPDLTGARTLRRVLRRPAVAREGSAPGVAKPPPALLTRVIVPDAYLLSWVAWSVPRIRELIHSRQIDCVITTSPPESAHLVGLMLGRRGPAWVADFRDGWSFEGLREPFPTAAQRRLDARLEREVAARADQVTAATLPLVDDLRSRYGCDAALVPNAWDTDLEPEVQRATPPALAGDRVNLVYTGTLGGVRGHDDRALLEALRRIVFERPETSSRLRLVIAGRLTGEEARVLAQPDLAPAVQVLGPLDRPTAIALQRRADALLLVTSHHRSIVTGKLFEYLTAGKPILTLAGDNEAARIVRETGAGDVVAPDDVDGIVAALARVANRSLTYAPHGLEQFTYEAAAEVLHGRIENAISRAQARLGAR
jgi:glycosyltransferase involved in cell wall biosynthesis